MLEVIKRWYQTRFSDPDAVTLFLLLVACFAVLWLFGDLLAPLLVALVMAYLLEWPVSRLQRAGLAHPGHQPHSAVVHRPHRHGVPRAHPDPGEPGTEPRQESPAMLSHAQDYVRTLPEQYP